MLHFCSDSDWKDEFCSDCPWLRRDSGGCLSECLPLEYMEEPELTCMKSDGDPEDHGCPFRDDFIEWRMENDPRYENPDAEDDDDEQQLTGSR